MPVPAAGDLVLPPLDRVGVYRTDPPIPGYEQIAVNLLDPNESNIQPATAAPGGGGDAETVAGGKSRLDLWWWIVAAAGLPLLMVEWYVYSRRVHLWRRRVRFGRSSPGRTPGPAAAQRPRGSTPLSPPTPPAVPAGPRGRRQDVDLPPGNERRGGAPEGAEVSGRTPRYWHWL